MTTNSIKHIAITGAGGQISYSLLFRLAAGELFGPNQPIALHLLEVPAALDSLKGVVMELQDCAFPLLKEVVIGSDPRQVFKDVEFAFLVGAKPRSPGQERKDLLLENGKIFIEQGRALNDVASRNVKVLVVGNPCNTNCLIAMRNAPDLPKKNFFAMTRLDQNRAINAIADYAKVATTDVTHMTIWGNHSATQVPDFLNAQIKGRSLLDTIKDVKWLEGDFFKLVQERGTQILAARGKSSAASAASAAIDAMRSLTQPTEKGQWYSSGIISDENPYGIQPGLIFSFPCRTLENGEVEIVKDLAWDDFLKQKISLTEKELLEERSLI